jgi:hypothetical protein
MGMRAADCLLFLKMPPGERATYGRSFCLAGALALGLILPGAGLGASLIAASTANALGAFFQV